MGASANLYDVTWSAHVEFEAQRVLNRRFKNAIIPPMELSNLRETWGYVLSDPGSHSRRFKETSASDRAVLADVESAAASILVTEDVDDFDELDLISIGVTAIHFDLFMSLFLDGQTYEKALGLLSRDGLRIVDLHKSVSRLHPRLFQRFASRFPDVEPESLTHNEPAVIVRPAGSLHKLSDRSGKRNHTG
jgi:hypothetical protein